MTDRDKDNVGTDARESTTPDDAETGPAVGPKFAVAECEELAQVRYLASAGCGVSIVVFERHWAGEWSEGVNQGGGGDGAGEMGHDADIVRLAEGGDLHHFRDAADVGQRRADVIEVVILDQAMEIPALAPFLASGNGHRGQLPQFRNILVERLGAHGILDEIRFQIFQFLAGANGVGKIETLVQVNDPVTILAHPFPHVLAILDDLPHAFVGFKGGAGPRHRRGVNAKGAKTVVHGGFGIVAQYLAGATGGIIAFAMIAGHAAV